MSLTMEKLYNLQIKLKGGKRTITMRSRKFTDAVSTQWQQHIKEYNHRITNKDVTGMSIFNSNKEIAHSER